MKKARIAELKARLSEYLRGVRAGEALLVMDRETPVARIVPYAPEGDPPRSRAPLRRYESLQKVPLPPPLRLDVDVVDLLLEERRQER